MFSRAKANWKRFAEEKERLMWIFHFWKRSQQWENPAESLALMATLVTLSFYPQIVSALALLALVAYILLTAPKRPEKPPEMLTDPQDDDKDDEVSAPGAVDLPVHAHSVLKVSCWSLKERHILSMRMSPFQYPRHVSCLLTLPASRLR